jgi:3-hydroxyisobutyrate dehydrogenase/2-hydroxy-3-oxopropionate reductase
MLEVGILGTGRMGSAMARRLAGQGASVVVYNRSRAKAEDLATAIGATVADRPADVASRVDVLISMVADESAVEALYRGPDGAIAGLGRRTVAVDMSTVAPSVIRGLEADVRATGAGVLDAPVSGSVPVAEAGTLTIMAGGEAADLDRARPALDLLSTRIFHMGPLGTGATIKLAVNAIVFGLSQSLAESLVLAERAGVDRSAAWEVFKASAIGAPFVHYKRDAFVEPGAHPVAFSFDLVAKDLGLILGLADQVGATMPQATLNLEQVRTAASALGGDRDLAEVAVLLRGESA